MKQKFFLVFLSCLICISLFSISAFAVDAETTSESVDWFTPSPTIYYKYVTRTGSEWYKDLPSVSVSIGNTCVINRAGDSPSHTSTTGFKLVFGDSMYVTNGSGSVPAICYRDRSGTVTNYTLSGFSDSVGATFYCTESSITSLGGDTIYGIEVKSGGGFVSDGLNSGLSSIGDVFSFILNSPILICVGISVGVFFVGLGISKVKDLIKGY